MSSKPENGENFEITYDLHVFSGLLDMYFQFTERKTFSLLKMTHYERTPKYFLNEPLRNILSKSVRFFYNLLSSVNYDQTIR